MATSSIAGFIDYDAAGRPFMGLLIEEGGVSVKVYLGHKDKARTNAHAISKAINDMAEDLRNIPDKLVMPTVSDETMVKLGKAMMNNGTVRGAEVPHQDTK